MAIWAFADDLGAAIWAELAIRGDFLAALRAADGRCSSWGRWSGVWLAWRDDLGAIGGLAGHIHTHAETHHGADATIVIGRALKDVVATGGAIDGIAKLLVFGLLVENVVELVEVFVWNVDGFDGEVDYFEAEFAEFRLDVLLHRALDLIKTWIDFEIGDPVVDDEAGETLLGDLVDLAAEEGLDDLEIDVIALHEGADQGLVEILIVV